MHTLSCFALIASTVNQCVKTEWKPKTKDKIKYFWQERKHNQNTLLFHPGVKWMNQSINFKTGLAIFLQAEVLRTRSETKIFFIVFWFEGKVHTPEQPRLCDVTINAYLRQRFQSKDVLKFCKKQKVAIGAPYINASWSWCANYTGQRGEDTLGAQVCFIRTGVSHIRNYTSWRAASLRSCSLPWSKALSLACSEKVKYYVFIVTLI